MLKRTECINICISMILSFFGGAFIQMAVSQGNIFFGIFSILAFIASTINLLCGSEKDY